jgi:hypothetical protein
VNIEVCVIVPSRDLPRRFDGKRVGALRARARARDREIEFGEGTVAGPQEAVTAACVRVVSRDRSRRVDAAGRGVCGAPGIEGGQGTVGGSQEAVKRAVV